MRSLEEKRAYNRAWYHRNKDKVKLKTPEKELRRKARYNSDPEYAERRRETSRRAQLKHRRGVTVEERETILTSQGNRSAICRTDKPGGNGQWHVDHCHEAGAVRGVLCHACNTGLGFFQDSEDRLLAAVDYLARFKAKGTNP